VPYITVEEEVWVDLDDFETEDLVEELKKRNSFSEEPASLVEQIYLAKHVRHQPYDQLVDELIYQVTGKIV
jgi:hypothetical protein